MKKKPTKKVVVSKKQAPKKQVKAPTKKTGFKTLLGKVLKPSSKKTKDKPMETKPHIVLAPQVLKFKKYNQAQDYMEAKQLSDWKIFENQRGGFYLHKKHRDLINQLNKERQTIDTMRAYAIGLGAMVYSLTKSTMIKNKKPIEVKAPGYIKPVKKLKKLTKKTK